MNNQNLQRNPNEGTPSLPKLTREVSVMAWIENELGHVLMVRQASGNKVWTLPGGKIRLGEDLQSGLKREVMEEIGVALRSFKLVGLYDRITKRNLTILYRASLQPGPFQPKDPAEIAEIAFKSRIPSKVSTSAKYFWTQRIAIWD